MATRREKVLQATVAALNGAGRPAGFTAHRFRTRPLERETQLPAGAVYPTVPPLGGESERVRRWDHDPGVERMLNLRVELRVSGAQPDAAIDPLYAWTVKALLNDAALKALIDDIKEVRSTFDAVELATGPAGACAVDFEVTYSTDEYDPDEG